MEDITDEGLLDEQRFNSIALEATQGEAIRNSTIVNVSISIESFQIVEERLRKHVVYKITGEENGNKFDVYRRYKEFRILHRVLTQIWPGCVIPKLPPKKAVGNMKTSFIDKRKKLLETFLIKVSALPYFCICEAFSSFLHNSLNYSKIEKDLKAPTVQEISILYSDIFSEYTYFQPSLEQKIEIKELQKDVQELYEILKKVKKQARLSSFAFGRYEESISGLMNGLKTITPMLLINKNLNVTAKENYVNPYLNIRDWLRSDILDVESMMDGLNKYFVLEDDIGSVQMRIEKKKKHLEQLQSGKKSISERLTNKTNEALVEEEGKGIEELESYKESLEKITNISIGKLLQCDIPKFKQQKIYKICVTMRNYSLATVQEYQEIAEQILQIEESLGR
ncbi:hypothetical protein SteCoe_22129 [Stentor coeruleus]|uniref:PX domain-containing protein n=1 Tax=Stentor coeruleus TaxID=5963 RepID=A0A1R2BN21_9CILI|nr:hypothetical protein SteCoe_23402 [Stentor coeruleus]OMJ78114.1 hypothetical protein SteCoe_22129 [Stentor coeruleus]